MFLDTMKQQYPNRHQHQLDLFENLEKELKSIIDVFNNERYQKRIEVEGVKHQLKDCESQLRKEREAN